MTLKMVGSSEIDTSPSAATADAASLRPAGASAASCSPKQGVNAERCASQRSWQNSPRREGSKQLRSRAVEAHHHAGTGQESVRTLRHAKSPKLLQVLVIASRQPAVFREGTAAFPGGDSNRWPLDYSWSSKSLPVCGSSIAGRLRRRWTHMPSRKLRWP